jgi:hypothetical protein
MNNYDESNLAEARDLKKKFKANGKERGNWFSGSWKGIEEDQQRYYELYQLLKKDLKFYSGKPEGVKILKVIGDEHANEGYAWACGVEYEQPLYTSNKAKIKLASEQVMNEYDEMFCKNGSYTQFHSKPVMDPKTFTVKLTFRSEEEAIIFLQKVAKTQKPGAEPVISYDGKPKWKIKDQKLVDMENKPVKTPPPLDEHNDQIPGQDEASGDNFGL